MPHVHTNRLKNSFMLAMAAKKIKFYGLIFIGGTCHIGYFPNYLSALAVKNVSRFYYNGYHLLDHLKHSLHLYYTLIIIVTFINLSR